MNTELAIALKLGINSRLNNLSHQEKNTANIVLLKKIDEIKRQLVMVLHQLELGNIDFVVSFLSSLNY